MKKTRESGSFINLTVAVFIIANLVVVAAAYLYYRFEKERIRDQKYLEIAAIAQLKIGEIQEWRKERLADIQILTREPAFRRELEAWIRNPDAPQVKADLVTRLQTFQQAYRYSDALVIDPEGHILFSTGSDPDPVNAVGEDAIKRALASSGPILTDFYRDTKGDMLLDALNSVLDLNGKPMAVGVLRSSAGNVLYPLLNSWPIPTNSAESLMVRQDGDFVLFLNEDKHQPDAVLSRRDPLGGASFPHVRAVLGELGMFEGKDHLGVNVLADLRPVADSPWFLVSKVDQNEILSEVNYRAGVVVVFSLGFVLLSGAALAYVYRRRQTNVYRDLYRLEKQQNEMQRLFRTILYSVGDGLITTDTQGIIQQMNSIAEKLTGWTEQDATGRHLNEIFRVVNEVSHHVVESPIQSVVQNQKAWRRTARVLLVSKNGTEISIEDSAAPIFDENGLLLGAVLVLRDVTEEIKRWNETQEIHQRYKSVFDNAGIGIILQDREGNVLQVNRSLTKMLGYPEAELLKKNVVDLTHSEDKEMSIRNREALIAGEIDSYALEKRYLSKDGDIVWASLYANAIRDDKGNRVGAVTVIADITERKRVQLERQKIERKISRAHKLESLAVMANGIAHDFNNLLMGILGNLEFASEILPQDSEARKRVDAAIHAADQWSSLSRKMQLYSGHTLFTPKNLDVNELLSRNRSFFQLVVPRNVSFKMDSYGKLPPIRGDAEQLQRLVMNLLINANEAIGGAAGQVTVKTGLRDCEESYLNRSKIEEKPDPGQFIFMEIADTGGGMDAETLDKLFDPFFSTKSTGRGLGMAEVMGIVRAHNGAIIIESEMGKGTTVQVLFPTSKETQVSPVKSQEVGQIQPPASEGVSRRKTILLVDDESMVRDLTASRLDVLGYNTITAVNGEDGLEKFKQHMSEIDLVMLDYAMPKMNGIEAFGELIRIKPDVKVIFCTGYSEKALLHDLPSQDSVSILHKPYNRQTLKDELDRMMGNND